MTRGEWGRMVLKVLAAVLIVGMLVVVAGMRAQLDRLKHDLDLSRQGKSPAATARLQYQAEQYYFRCHPADPLTDPVEIRLCERYDTLEHAYAAQGTTPPTG